MLLLKVKIKREKRAKTNHYLYEYNKLWVYVITNNIIYYIRTSYVLLKFIFF